MMNTNDVSENYAVIRKPIFDKKKNVVAYDIKIKDFNNLEDDERYIFESSDVFDKLLTQGFTKISNGKKIFIFFNFDAIKKELPMKLPNEKIGVNIDDIDHEDTELTVKLEKVKSKGFTLVVDGYDFDKKKYSLRNIADILTVDFRNTSIKNRNSVLSVESEEKVKLLARDVETESDFELAVNKGFDYFQGNFFIRTDIMPIQNIPSFKLNLVDLLKELNREQLDFAKVEEILKRDVALTYKLLKLINSASMGIKTTITSIGHALNLLGEVDLKKWLFVMIMSSLGSDKPLEALRISLVRAKFCEITANELGLKEYENDYFLTGMFSLIDVFMGRPLEELVDELPLKNEIKDALSGKNNQITLTLKMIKDYENGYWKDVKQSLTELELPEKLIGDIYSRALEWSDFLDDKII